MFLPEEVTTLTALWESPSEWFMYLYRLSDRFIEDGDSDGGRFFQWLSKWKQRPVKREACPAWGYYWWTYYIEASLKSWRAASLNSKNIGNYLPFFFSPCCVGNSECSIQFGTVFDRAEDHSYPCFATGLIAAMDCWKGFSEETKLDLEFNWVDK